MTTNIGNRDRFVKGEGSKDDKNTVCKDNNKTLGWLQRCNVSKEVVAGITV